MIWTPEREEQVKTYWLEKGMSAAEIAAIFPHCTRNAVIGKVCRLLGANSRRRAPSAPKMAAPKAVLSRPCARAAVAVYAPEPPPRRKDDKTWAVTEAARPLLALEACHCRWPVGAATGAEQLFCGVGTETPGARYCASHARASGSVMSAEDWARRNAKALQRAMVS